MKRKVLSVALATCLFAGLLAGCGGSSSDSKESSSAEKESADTSGDEASEADTSESETSEKPYEGTTITFWMQPYGNDPSLQTAFLDEITADFYDQTGITVDYTITDWSSANKKITLACTGGEAPDVGDGFFTSSFAQMSSDEYGLLPLDDVVEEMGGEDTWIVAGKDECCVDGTWYGIPWRADVRAMMYNTEYFEEAGITEVPTTWDELVKAAQMLTVKDENGNITRAGLAWNADVGRYDQLWFSILAQSGGSMMNEDFTEFTFDSEEGKESLQFLSDVINVYDICNNSLDSSYNALTEFAAGNSAILFGVPGETENSLLSTAPQMEGKYASAVLPTKTGEEACCISFSAPIFIYKSTQNPEAAKEWLKYFCSYEVQLEASKTLSLLNSRADVMADPYFAEDEWLGAFAESATNAVSGDMPLTTWSQMDAWPDGPIPHMCAQVVDGQDIDAAIEECMESLEKIGW